MTRFLKFAGALPLAATLLAGCLTPQNIQATRYYTVATTPALPGAPLTDQSLGMRPLLAARPYKLEVAYRAEANRLAYLPRSEWAELPGTLVSRAVMDAIAHSRIFGDAGDAATMARPDLMFTGELRRFEADYSGHDPEFVVAVSGIIRTTAGGAAVWNGDIAVRVPLQAPNSGAATDANMTDIARAASEAVTQLSAEICESIRAALAAR